MEYIGEHLLPGEIGRFSVSLAFGAAIVAFIAYYLNSKTEDKRYHKIARSAFLAHAAGVIGIVLSLFYLLLSHYFEYDYVWKHSSLDLEQRFVFSAFWEGQEGSFILWLFWHAILGLILMFTAKKWENHSMMVFSAVQAFLASMVLGIFPFGLKVGSSPFILMRETADNIGLPWTQVADYLDRFPAFMDGSGLNPLLQNYWMTIHPPTLFLGFASTLVPFAFAIAALLKGDLKSWVKPALPWAFFSVGILGLGILMGGAWAYEALSFGGFWAWDPVENSSLVPWIVMVGAAHLLLIYRNKKTGLRAAVFMSILSFILILYSTFLTRSGVLGDSSVHAFVDLGLSGQLLIYLLFFTVIALGLLIWRYRQFPSEANGDDLSSREFWMFIGSLILLISSFQIIFSTSIPVINKLIGPDGFISLLSDEMAPPLDAIKHYNSWQLPFSIVTALLIAIGQYLRYGKTKAKSFWKSISLSLAISLVITGLFAQLYSFWSDPLYLALLLTGIFAAVSNLWFWIVIGKRKWSFAGSSVAHFGFALILVGALISNGRQDVISHSKVNLGDGLPANENALMDLGDTIEMGRYQAVFEGMDTIRDKQFYEVSYFNSIGDAEPEFSLKPFLQMSEQMGPTPNPDTKHFWDRDIYTHVTYSSYLEPVSPDGFVNEAEVKLNKGDTAIYRNHFVILDSLSVNALFDEETQELKAAKLTSHLRVVNVLGEEFPITPAYIIENEMKDHRDTILDVQRMKFRFDDVELETKKIVLKAWTEQEEGVKPFIVQKAIIFPMINILWIGCILMVIGSFIAVWQRILKS
ncbi:MAG: cytochrome c biogenesis protein CcsA [Bacteroidetes bacterium]|nr:cytochrome c biogenesis protein CcsA [Bacteroidota bacterium]